MKPILPTKRSISCVNSARWFFGQRHDFTEECRARQSAEPDEHVIESAAGMDHNSHAIEGTAARNSLNHDKTMLATSCGFSTAEK